MVSKISSPEFFAGKLISAAQGRLSVTFSFSMK